MVRSCSAHGCTNRFVKGSNIQFHGFPLKNDSLNQQWIDKVKRKNFVPTKHSMICSEHFRDDDYLDRPGRSYKVLKPNACPSVFSQFPEYCQPAMKKERKSMIAKLENHSIELIPNSTESGVTTGIPELMANSNSLNTLSSEPLISSKSSAVTECILVSDSVSLREVSTQTETSSNDEKVHQLREKNVFLLQKVRVLQQKIRRRNKTISNLQKKLVNCLEGMIENETSPTDLTSRFDGSDTDDDW